MKVFALVGKSGTGKSFQAINVCREYDIEAIIDDGLFIDSGRAIAGKSAKRVHTKIGAIKTALFMDPEHRENVLEAIKKEKPKNILVIGTSQGMVEKICKTLELGEIDQTVLIEEITTEKERKIAEKQRHGQGKHVVPAPSFQLKNEFSGYFLSPLRMFRSRNDKGNYADKGSDSEKSVVRPTYSYLGEYFISDRVITDIIKCVGSDIDGVESITRVITEKHRGQLFIHVNVKFKFGYPVIEVAKEFQKSSKRVVESMTAFNIEKINIEIRGIV